jgi:transmembrane sensor
MEKMDYSEFTVNSFLENPTFIKWVLMPDSELDLYWENWLSEHPEKFEDVRQARAIIFAFQYKKYKRDEVWKRKTWAAIEMMNEKNDNSFEETLKIVPVYPDQGQKGIPTSRFSWKIVAKWAAVFIGILLMAVVTINEIGNKRTNKKESIFTVTEITPRGQKSKISLPDGSIVHLNAVSSLSYSSDFSTDKRQIILSGEAFFQVAKDSLRPFVVIADKLITTALGTSFNIKAYPEDKEVLISLLTGRVSVQRKGSAESVLFLNPREAARLNHEEGILMRKEFNYEQDILWKDGILFFKETHLEDVFKRLEKWYGISFKLENIPRRPVIVTGKFDNENLKNVLLSLSYTSNFTYSIENEKVIVSFK